MQQDPEWVRLDTEREAVRRDFESFLADDERPVVDALRAAGSAISSVWDLVNTTESYPSAIPVLLSHLSGAYHLRTKQGITRALTVREARGTAARRIIESLAIETDGELRWALANALTVVAEADDAAVIRRLSTDPHYADVHERLSVAARKADRRK